MPGGSTEYGLTPIYISDPAMVMRPKTGAKPALPQKPGLGKVGRHQVGGQQVAGQGVEAAEGGPGPPRQDQTAAPSKTPSKECLVQRVPISFRSPGSPHRRSRTRGRQSDAGR